MSGTSDWEKVIDMGGPMTALGGGLFGALIVPAAILGLTLWFVLYLRSIERLPVATSNIDEAIEIVRQRFVRGEIEAAEYSRLVTELTRTT